MPPVEVEQLAKQYNAVMASIDRVGRRYNSQVLEKMIALRGLDEAQFLDAAVAEPWFEELVEMLNADSAESRYELRLDKAPNGGLEAAVISVWRHGVSTDYTYPVEFFASPEYRGIRALHDQLDGLLGPGAYVQRGEKKQEVSSFHAALEWLMNQARKGQHVQRYKGLGEMNPEQLWETTMNPESRRMLQVQIEDAIAADQIFTTLMGDHVEPRRDFIEDNALNVANLDV